MVLGWAGDEMQRHHFMGSLEIRGSANNLPALDPRCKSQISLQLKLRLCWNSLGGAPLYSRAAKGGIGVSRIWEVEFVLSGPARRGYLPFSI